MPSDGTTSSYPGYTTGSSSSSSSSPAATPPPLTSTSSSRPSSVARTTTVPPSASASVTRASATRSLPSRRYTSCGFSSTTNTRSAGSWLHCWFPFPGNVILVPFFHPGFTSIDRISDSVFILLIDDVAGDLHVLGDADVELLQGARQLALHRRRLGRRRRATAAVVTGEPASSKVRAAATGVPGRLLLGARRGAGARVAVRERRAPEELGEDVVSAAAAAAGLRRRATGPEPLLPVLVVQRPLPGNK
ncbi:Os08g0374500 [Oryza sativa Japonica Group]|uniref:Os08g0374500 protein n=1 Tax=Oryza sativa subsp. japonica TaxID=39947 RepID=A0A0P0XFD0_ORYSJ|nr:hypothetical protein EE612_043886 [Oryza sativa]BAT05180.1 Os08g0374500 [Oryza sativa Japonica Group]